MDEGRTIGKMEAYYLKYKRNNIYIALENIQDSDFFWSLDQVSHFDYLWKKDIPIKKIAKIMHRSEKAVFFLALDRLDTGKIKKRVGWNMW